ncbi:AAA family ATPase [Pseudophaeobacter sp. 1A09344]|uniref:AAA family ATPase n=1 Tax=Pseudophaeobacter sp. 1A09344 TaxID=3098144 RepID=UPI0034D4BF2B
MSVIVFANSKGGVGKSTSAVLLAQVLAHRGATVSLIDADPNQPLSAWWSRDPRRIPDNLKLIPKVTEDTITEIIDDEASKSAFVIVDLEGSANLAVTYAIGRADLVLIPMQGSQLDADQTKRVIDLICREERAFRRSIPYSVFFTRTSAAIRSRDLGHIQADLKEALIPTLPVELTERAAFRAIMQLGGTIYDLTKDEVSKPKAAIENAEAFAREVALITRNQTNKGRVAA